MATIFMIIGIVFLGIGLIIYFFNGIPFLGKLPGDFTFRKGNVSFYFPLATSIVVSVILSLILYLVNKLH